MQQYFDQNEVKNLLKLVRLGGVILVIFLAIQTLAVFKNWRQPAVAYSTIVVSGEGEAFAPPDIATFTFSVSADAKTVGGAQDTVTTKTDSILEALKALGIEEKDIRTSDYSVYPKYTYEPIACTMSYCPPSRQIPDGYTVTHSISVKIRNTADAGQALSVAGARGATNISSLAFSIDDPDSLMNEARDEAVNEARDKAKTLAKSLGVRLGRVVDFSDNTWSPGIYPTYLGGEAMGMGGDAVKAVSVPTGENKITSSVTITYEIR